MVTAADIPCRSGEASDVILIIPAGTDIFVTSDVTAGVVTISTMVIAVTAIVSDADGTRRAPRGAGRRERGRWDMGLGGPLGTNVAHSEDGHAKTSGGHRAPTPELARTAGSDGDVAPLTPTEKRPLWLARLDRWSIALCALAWLLAMLHVAPAFSDPLAWLPIAIGVLAGYLLADLLSGTVHRLADRFFDPRTPILGPALIAPFREHHADALAMTRHDFFEVSGNNGLATIPLAIAVFVLPPPTSLLTQLLAAGTISLGLSIVATNQFHCWAHVAVPPRWVRPLQNWGLILSPKRHDLHHRPEHDRAYCVTSGWLNPVLDRYRVFARLERSLDLLRRKPSGTD